MRVIIQKPDLDTCLTGLILLVSDRDNIEVVAENADEKDILNPSVICIECGGTGLVDLNNFDHHDPERYFPPACLQAYKKLGYQDKALERLVQYVCIVDDRPDDHAVIPFPSLSNIFSGMLLVEKGIKNQFLKGMDILKRLLNDYIDPFSTMPSLPEWTDYIEAKKININKIEEIMKKAEFYRSKGGLRIGFLESHVIGGIGTLYKAGCDVVVVYNPLFGEPPRPKFTIASNGKNVVKLLPFFDKMEKGWGGRQTIIGSPKTGSILKPEEVLEIILKNL